MVLNINIPTQWNQLSFNQLKEITNIIEYFHSREDKIKASPSFLTRMYFQIIKQLLRNNNFLKTWYAINKIPVGHYKDYVSFIFKDVNRTKFVERLHVKGKWRISPASKLSNITIKEFSFIDVLYYNWKITKDQRYLDLLCAALYREEDKSLSKNSIDYRVPFSNLWVEKTVEDWKNVPKKVKYSIAYTYEGCRNYTRGLYKNVFPQTKGKVDVEGKEIKPNKQEYVPFGKLIHYKVGFDPSKIKDAENILMHEFLSIWENELVEIQKRKK